VRRRGTELQKRRALAMARRATSRWTTLTISLARILAEYDRRHAEHRARFIDGLRQLTPAEVREAVRQKLARDRRRAG
jgi:hypothetical protein